MPGKPSDPSVPPWTFLSNHGHVLLEIARDPVARMRDVATRVGITERAVQRIVRELDEAGYLVRNREGRRNTYRVRWDQPLRHPSDRHAQISSLAALVGDLGEASAAPRPTKPRPRAR